MKAPELTPGKCGKIMDDIDNGFNNYRQCSRDAKYLVIYQNHGKVHHEILCKTHRNQLKKWTQRVFERHNIRTNYTEKEL